MIREQFGDAVAAIVAGCSDTFEEAKPPWRERKQAYLDHLVEPGVSESVLRVSLADKLHNRGCPAARYRTLGERVFEPVQYAFGRGSALVLPLAHGHLPRATAGPMAEELARVVAELE